MIARLPLVTAWVLACAAAAGGAYWALLNTPESSMAAIGASVVLFLVAAALAAFTVTGARLLWSEGWSTGLARRALAAAPVAMPVLIIPIAMWMLAEAINGAVVANTGPISATSIASFGWADPSPFFTAVGWGCAWLRWVVGPLLALAVVAALLAHGTPAPLRTSLARAFAPVSLAWSTLVFAALIAAPWRYLAPWRPRGLPATTVEIAFVGAKLAATALLMAAGVALLIRSSVTIAREK